MVMMAILNMPDLTMATFLKSMAIVMTIVTYIILIYQLNINVTSMWRSASVETIKYIHKYIYKGRDRHS